MMDSPETSSNKGMRALILFIIAIVVLAIIGGGAWFLTHQLPLSPQTSTTTPTGNIGNPPPAAFTYTNATKDNVVVDSPAPGATVGHAITVIGKARGNWYFEASFPLSIEDPVGHVIDQTPAQAQGDWMTTDFVPFSGTLMIPPNYSGPAIIIIHNDNPSGDPARDASVSFPVTIQ
jgi:hypothetical protein